MQVLDERIARDGPAGAPKVLYTVPVGQNPTGAVKARLASVPLFNFFALFRRFRPRNGVPEFRFQKMKLRFLIS